jgi:hypothetical protein
MVQASLQVTVALHVAFAAEPMPMRTRTKRITHTCVLFIWSLLNGS